MSDKEIDKILALIQEEQILYLDLRFTDTHGKEQHVTIPTSVVDKTFFKKEKCSTDHLFKDGKE